MSFIDTGLSDAEQAGPRPGTSAFSVREVADQLGVCEASVYKALERGEHEAVTLGGRRLIPARCIDRLLTAKAV